MFKEEEPLNVENLFIDDNDIFDSKVISNADREYITDLINRANVIANAKKLIEESNVSKMEIVYPEEKRIEKKEQMSIDDDEKRQNASAEKSLMKKVKIKNEFKERMGEYYEEKPFKIPAERKKINMVKFQMLLKKK